MIQVPAFITVPARAANIEAEPIMGGAYRSLRGLGDDTSDDGGIDWTKIITAGEQATAQIITATNQPAICPIGQIRNASGICTPVGATGVITTPVGSAAVGLSGTTVAMLALAGLVVLVLVLKK